jgi:uncharacterized Zn-binding protein involved in type VI secretion
MNGVIRLNDPLVSGGKVIKASGAQFMGLPVALKGDEVTCTEHKGRSLLTIVTQPGR